MRSFPLFVLAIGADLASPVTNKNSLNLTYADNLIPTDAEQKTEKKKEPGDVYPHRQTGQDSALEQCVVSKSCPVLGGYGDTEGMECQSICAEKPIDKGTDLVGLVRDL